MTLPRFLTFASGSREALSRIGGRVIPCPVGPGHATATVELADDDVMTPGEDAVGVRCEEGNVWVTDSGADVTLRAGEEYATRREGKVVVQSFGRSRVRVRYG